MNSQRRMVLALGAAALCGGGNLAAQPAAQPKVRRIGYLTTQAMTEAPSPERAAFIQGLRELGYVVGRNLVIEYRSSDNDQSRLPELAAELVRQRVELILAGGTEAAIAARTASTSLPVVFGVSGDPVKAGLVKSYARPGGNVTGLSLLAPELSAKRFALVRELVPQARRVAVMWNARGEIAALEWKETEEAARRLGIATEALPIDETGDMVRALDSLPRARPDAVLVIVDERMTGFRKIIADAALRARVPCVASWREYVVSGALASYAPDMRALFHRAAYYVDRILRGARPADLPVEQPTKFDLVVNLKTAKALGIEVPRSVLLRADEVIE